MASDYGFVNNVGTDISFSALDLARVNLNNTSTLLKNVEESLGEQLFDVITFIDSIAHIKDVRTVLADLKSNNMHNDSLLIIRTPAINSYYLFYAGILKKILPKKYGNYLYFISTRYILFNEYSIKLFLASLGFQLVLLECQMDHKKKINFKSLRSLFSYLAFQLIPEVLNKNNSIIIVARQL